ncbi:hypothetical protein M501DRAFT_997042, partial [Patellaria atrata CBS 101060]
MTSYLHKGCGITSFMLERQKRELATANPHTFKIATPPGPVEQSHENGLAQYNYNKLFESIIQQKKDDRSYRYFRNINRLAKDFPFAHSDAEEKKVDVWCTNDYVSLEHLLIL